ncbi:hypothetical protein K2P97_07665 [bacterium]|nr:hypothetical protein [bacterium]
MFLHVKDFKHFIIWLQIFCLSFYSSQAWTQSSRGPIPNANQLELFASTEPVQTDKGMAHLEVRSFEINTIQDLEQAKSEVLQKIRTDYKTGQFFVMGVQSADHQEKSLDQAAQLSINEIEALIEAEVKVKPAPLTVENPTKVNFFKRHYNLTLGFVRFVANASVVSTGLIIGKGVAPEHALLVGTLAGALSGIMQVKSEALFKWLSNSVLLVKAAQKTGLLSKQETRFTQTAEKTLKEVEMYGRWASLEAGFLLICQAAMTILNIPVAENLALTVAKSTASQGVYEVGVMKAAQQLEKMNPRWSNKISVFKNVSLFTGSGISVLAAIGSMIDMPFSNLGFVVLTGAGIVLNFSSKIKSLFGSTELIFRRWKAVALHLKCADLLN